MCCVTVEVGQTVVVTQGLPGVLRAEQSAPLHNWHDVVDEVFETAGNSMRRRLSKRRNGARSVRFTP